MATERDYDEQAAAMIDAPTGVKGVAGGADAEGASMGGASPRSKREEYMDRGKSKCAFVVDEDFLRRKDFAGVSESQNLDLRSSGQRDVDAKVLTRCTALYLQNPNAHMRVIPFSMK